MTHITNQYWLDSLWDSIGGGANVDDHPLEYLDVNYAANVIKLVKEYLHPEFERLNECEKTRLKETFRYALNFYDDLQLEGAFDRVLPPFDAPRNIRHFYELIWNHIFDGEDWKIHNSHYYTNDDNITKHISDGCI